MNQVSPAILAKIRALGVTVTSNSGNLVVAHVTVEHLEKLAAFAEVRSITPAPAATN
jgi:hypothetical protein